jgi:hypothetical protein
VYGEEAIDISSFRHWVRLFKSGEKVIDEGPRIGGSTTAAATEIKGKVDAPTWDDLRTITSELRAAIGIGKRAVMAIIEELGYRKFLRSVGGKNARHRTQNSPKNRPSVRNIS